MLSKIMPVCRELATSRNMFRISPRNYTRRTLSSNNLLIKYLPTRKTHPKDKFSPQLHLCSRSSHNSHRKSSMSINQNMSMSMSVKDRQCIKKKQQRQYPCRNSPRSRRKNLSKKKSQQLRKRKAKFPTKTSRSKG